MKRAFLIVVVLFILIQFIQVDKNNPKTDPNLEVKAPKAVMNILKRSCYDCHSNKTIWPWYSYIAPVSWSVKRHVHDGRRWVNFSIWNKYTKTEKKKKLNKMYKAVYAAMPIRSYKLIHRNSKLSPKDIQTLRAWIYKLE